MTISKAVHRPPNRGNSSLYEAAWIAKQLWDAEAPTWYLFLVLGAVLGLPAVGFVAYEFLRRVRDVPTLWRTKLVRPPRTPDLAPQRDGLPELDHDHGPLLCAPVRVHDTARRSSRVIVIAPAAS